MVWVESPTNPTCRVVDIRQLAASVKKHPGVLLAMDNTFLTSYYSVKIN
jgi:cystathionine gamma-lyase